MIPEHHCYVEPFAGALWVYFGKKPSKVEVINDVDRDLITFYSVLKNNFNNFIDKFEHYLISRDEFNHLKDVDKANLNDVMIAYRFFYLNKNSFGGNMSSFNSYYRDKPYINDRAIKLLNKAHSRLKNTWIENIDYKEVIKRFDKKNTFIFLDPPYYKTCNETYKYGENINFVELKELLEGIESKWLLTVNDVEYTREVFKDFYIKETSVNYSISKSAKGRGRHGELIITNYKT